MMRRLPSLVAAACMLLLACSCKFLPMFGRRPADERPGASAGEDAKHATPVPANPRGPQGEATDAAPFPRRYEWPERTRFPIHKPDEGEDAVDISDPRPEVGEPPEETTPDDPSPTAPPQKDELVRLMEAVADEPESRKLIEAMLQTVNDRPDRAFALLQADSLKNKKMLVNLLKAYVRYELGDAENAISILDNVFRDMLAQMPMQVESLEFCRKVQSYGKYEPFSHRVFRPTEQVILYIEPHYFTCKKADEEYTISLNVRYSIINAEGRQVWQTEHAVNHRTTRYLYDLFLTQFIRMPSLAEGNYTLKIELQDMLSQDQHRAEGEVQFEIRNL